MLQAELWVVRLSSSTPQLAMPICLRLTIDYYLYLVSYCPNSHHSKLCMDQG